MIPLNSDQKQLIFDYYFGLTSQEQNVEAEALISSNEQAAVIHTKLKATLEPLNSLEPESCPDSLVERTVRRLNSAANPGQDQLEQLLAGEQSRGNGAKGRLWATMAGRLAAAAAFVILGSVLLTTFRYFRYNSRLHQCQMQQGNIFQGLTKYISEHDGNRPAVATAAGSPWWKLGAPGDENHSNTRHIFLLVKGGYVKPGVFVCPGSKSGSPPELTPSQIRDLKDFPDRRYVPYSFQIICHRTTGGKLRCRKVLMADWNPLFEELPEDFSKPFQLRLTKRLLTLNSTNHRRRGQNVLFGDGCVEFRKTRFIGTDDIFTLQDTDIYQGCEVPSCETDFFLAP